MISDPRLSSHFQNDPAGALLIGGVPAAEAAERAGGTPCFVYDSRIVETKISGLRSALPSRVHIHYAVKANPYAPLLTHIARRVDGLDIASAGEMRLALTCGVPADRISFAGPGKGDDELEAAISSGVTLNLESEGELERAANIGKRLGGTVRAAIRINPPFDLKGSGMKMGGGAKPFGVDLERVPAMLEQLLASGMEFRGYHVFAGSQNLSAEALQESQRQSVELIDRLVQDTAVVPPTANIGGGFGLPYFPGDEPLDVSAVGAGLTETLAAYPLPNTQVVIELGRYIVGDCGVYLTRVIDRKESGGQIFLITDGGLHHQLAASGNFGTVIRRNYPLAHAERLDASEEEKVNVVGRLCTPLDKLGEKVALPHTAVGDLLAIFMAGAYGRTASPEAFLGHPAAAELLL